MSETFFTQLPDPSTADRQSSWNGPNSWTPFPRKGLKMAVRAWCAGEHKIAFRPGSLPRCLRRAQLVEDLLPWLYLKGESTGDFTDALAALSGPNAKRLSAKTVARLKADRWTEDEAWQKRDLGNQRFLCIWADGVCFRPHLAEEKPCVLVIAGADEYGRRELLAMSDGFRESPQSPFSGFAPPPVGRRGAKCWSISSGED